MNRMICQVFRQCRKDRKYARMFERDLPDTGERVVVYRTLGTADAWCRPAGMFYSPGRFVDCGYKTEIVVHDGVAVKHTETSKVYYLSPGDLKLVLE
jgi:hypothetical protein